MQIDFSLFDLINGLAGRWSWLDDAGRGLAVFGVLAVLLLVQALAWWPRRDGVSRRGYAGGLLLAGVLCLALMGLEVLVCHFVLHRDVRGRPSVGRWTTLLVTPDGALSFPAWPVVLVAALSVVTWGRARAWGGVAWALTALLAVAHVFTGMNFPFDVLTGALLGAALGLTALRIGDRTRPATSLLVLWCLVILWGGTMALIVRPASTGAEEGGGPPAVSPDVSLDPPAALLTALRAAVAPAQAQVTAAHNARLTAVSVIVTTPNAALPLPAVTELARATVSAVYAGWPRAGYCTVTVQALFPGHKTGTLYTASVARAEMPAGGFPPGTPLPGPKFYHAQYLARPRR